MVFIDFAFNLSSFVKFVCVSESVSYLLQHTQQQGQKWANFSMKDYKIVHYWSRPQRSNSFQVRYYVKALLN